jgi:GTPase SAR1 family protein
VGANFFQKKINNKKNLQLWGFFFTILILLLRYFRSRKIRNVDKVKFFKFVKISRIYYKNVSGAIIVYDVNNSNSFEEVKIWKKDLDKFTLEDGKPIPTILVGNKVKRRIN